MSSQVRLGSLILLTMWFAGSVHGAKPAEERQALQGCTPGYRALSQERVSASDGWNGARVLVIGCEERLETLPRRMEMELTARFTEFFDHRGWTAWWHAQNRTTREEILAPTTAFQRGYVSDFLLYDSTAAEP